MYRARRIDKNVQVVRLSVDSHEDADNVIRDWLRSKRKRKRPAQKKTTEPATLFMQTIDKNIFVTSYQEYQNLTKQGCAVGGNTSKSVDISPDCIVKLKRARYARQKRNQREEAKLLEQQIVSIHTSIIFYITFTVYKNDTCDRLKQKLHTIGKSCEKTCALFSHEQKRTLSASKTFCGAAKIHHH